MKKSTKLISLILAVVMVFSASSFSAAASEIPTAAQGSLETLIKNDSLAQLVTWLLDNLAVANDYVPGTVLKLVYMFLPKDSDNKMMKSLAAEIGKAGDVTKLSDEKLAKVLLDWLDNSVLPDLAGNIPAWVTNLAKFIGLTVDLHNVDSLLATVVSATGLANSIVFDFGILNDLNSDALNGVKRKDGDIKVIRALFKWLSDNTGIIEQAVKGNLNLGIVSNYVDLSDAEGYIKNLPDFVKGWLYLLVDGYADKPDLKNNPKGGWGVSPYAKYTADEMLAAALVNLINDKYKKSKDDALTVVSQNDAKAVLDMSFYGMLAKYGPDLYSRFAVNFLNGTLKDVIGKLKDYPEAAKAFNMNYTFTKDSFNSAFTDANSTGFLGQFNNIVCIILKTILSDAAYKAIAPEAGGNDKLNANLTRMCRYVLPILGTYSANLGFADFSKFTADSVKTMELPEMAVAVLKIFFPTWFKANYDAKLVGKADTLAQLGLAAMKFVVTNTGWITLDNGFSAKEFTDKITEATIGTYSDKACVELIVGIGAKLGAYTLDAANARTHFTLDKAASANWTWQEYCDEIVDWAINFIKGLPAVMPKHVSSKPGEYDGYGPFYKVNVALNELIDFSFLNGVNDATFKLDSETLIFNTLLDNLFHFDLAALLKVFEVNTNAGNVLGGPVIKGTISVVDRILTALFNHTCGAQGEFKKELSCTKELSGSYDTKNGHYLGKPTEKAIDTHKYTEIVEKYVAPTCKDLGTQFFKCEKCEAEMTKPVAATGVHDYQYVDTDATTGIKTYKCSVCGDEKYEEPEVPVSTVPDNLGDVNKDNKIGSDDARLALRASVGLEPTIKEGTDAFKAADVNGDKKVGSDDARTILRLSVKLDSIEDIKAKYGKG